MNIAIKYHSNHIHNVPDFLEAFDDLSRYLLIKTHRRLRNCCNF